MSRWRIFLYLTAAVFMTASASAILWVSFPWKPEGPPVASRPDQIPTAPVSIEDAPLRGNRDARIVIVEFSDFQCPFCALFSRDTLPLLEKRYVAPGTVQIAVRHFPLPIHPMARKAAEAAECAKQQNRFWEIHDTFFAEPHTLDSAPIGSNVATLGVDVVMFRSCLASGGSRAVDRDVAQGTSLAIRGTPTFLIGTRQDALIHVTKVLIGAQPFGAFESALTPLLPSGGGDGSGSPPKGSSSR
jgi:protein-disulfide isomerase